MGSNKDSDDIRQYLPDLESIRREADPEVAERKLRQAQNNPELDRALTEMQQQKPTGQPLFQFPVVPALAKERTGPPPFPGQAARTPLPVQAVPPPFPAQAVPAQAVPPPFPATAQQSAGPQVTAAHPHGAAVQHGAAAAHHGATMTQRVPVQPQGAPVHAGAMVTQRVPVFGGAAAPQRAPVQQGVPVQQQGVPVQQPGAMAPSQWADRALPPIDKALLPSSLLPVTPPPVAVPKAPAATESTGRRRQWMPTWLMVLLAVIAVSGPFVLARILGREEPSKEPGPVPPPSAAPAPSTPAPPAASELLAPVVPGPPEAVEPSLDDTATASQPPAPPAPPAPVSPVPARPARAAPHVPQAPVAPAPTEKPLADDVMD
ncbi:hypothetical proline rich protein [Sorangium cellulosum So ce56]|uniref:Hypothetical proline rich protein n=1 Tax=Sorangium cellulosum (strain So ce56) TaxID=448385 RepID=A9EMW2_SORC5|nr:hypothetical protein [Sorangium cellulosum]CAN90790.1 hypothetical proline rich protein [Sorangium cellulosum So ce56]